MLKILIFCTFFISLSSKGQTNAYKSILTDYLTTQQSEWIQREITVNDSLIIIKTKSDSITDIQKFHITDIKKDNFENLGYCTIYRCLSMDKQNISLFLIPAVKKVEIIEAYVPNQSGIAPQHIRFYID